MLDNFCVKNKKYSWFMVDEDNSKILSTSKINKHLNYSEPQTLKYYLVTKENEIIRIDIDNGVTINISNGDYATYGLFNALLGIFDSFQIPFLVSFIRRYWAINIPLLLWFTTLMLGLAGFGGWSFGVGVISGIVTFFIAMYVLVSLDNPEEISALLLNTSVNHAKYSNKLGIPVYSVFTSTTTVVTILAGIATIASTALLIWGNK